jgi:hypothetical protein
MAGDMDWAIYSDESSYNYGAVRGAGAVSLRLADAARLGGELAALLRASGVRELKWEKVRTARMAFAARKALDWTLDRALGGELWIETLTWDVTTATASRARRPALRRLREAYTALLASVIARHASHTEGGGQSCNWRIVPDEQTAMPWALVRGALPQSAEITPERSAAQPLIQLADLFTGLAAYSRAVYDVYERWLCVPDQDTPNGITEYARGSQRYRFALLDDFYTTCVRSLPGISLQTRRGLYTWRTDAPIQFRFQIQGVG